MTQVTASVSIGFSSDSTSNNTFSAEIDSRDIGLNSGKTSFSPGDSVYILLYAGTDVTAITSFATSGGVSQHGGQITISKTEDISFVNATEASTQLPITGSYSIVWYAASTPAITKNGSKFTSSTKITAVGKITYETTAQPYVLSGVNPLYPSALVLFTGTTP